VLLIPRETAVRRRDDPQNLSKACQQLNERVGAEKLAARGHLAISTSRPLTVKSPVLEYSGSNDLRAALKARAGEMTRLIAAELREVRDYRAGRI
jgi:hypothetical protein